MASNRTRTVDTFGELAGLFFETRQIIRSRIPGSKTADPNAWLRCETVCYIGANRPTMQDIARHLRVKPPSATSLVSTLARAGFVRREASADKRVVRISLTRKGERELAAYRTRCTKTMRVVFEKLGRNKTAQLAAILRRLRDIHARS